MRSRAWDGDWPVTQRFGVNPDDYVDFGLAGHNGLDLGMPAGQLLHAPVDGLVVELADDQRSYGLYVKLETPDGLAKGRERHALAERGLVAVRTARRIGPAGDRQRDCQTQRPQRLVVR